MIEQLIIFSLSVYWLFHVLSRSDILAKPRELAARHAPKWLTYIFHCAFCFTWWVAIGLTLAQWVMSGWMVINLVIIFGAPVVNMMLDLVVKALIRANEPPPIGEGKILTGCDHKITMKTRQNVMSGVAQTPIIAGQLVYCNPRFDPWQGSLPEGWEMINPYGTGDVPGCPKLIGSKVRFPWSYDEKSGVIEEGYRDGDDCSGTWGQLKYRIRGDDGKVYSAKWDRCTMLSFNPLSHEQTK